MDFDYESLRVLEAVVRTGSFELAARHLNVTQSAISQRIKQLEERVGSLLVIRGRPCSPTEDGLVLCQHYDQVSLLEFELRARMEDHSEAQKLTANLRISVNNDSLATWFGRVVRRASDELNVRLIIIPDDQHHTEERLHSGEAMAVVTTNDRPISGCHITPIGNMVYHAVATPGFIARYLPKGLTSEALATAPAISFDQKDTLPEQWVRAKFGRNANLTAHQVPSYEGQLECCRDGAGWAIMPLVSVAGDLAAGRLVDLAPQTSVAVQLFWQYRTQTSRTLLRLTEIVTEVARDALGTITRPGKA